MPLKVDTATAEYQALQRKHKSEGNTIPKIFLIRADGKKLYAQSGSLPGQQLPALISAAIREMGRPLALGEVKVLEDINQKIKSALEQKDYRTAVSQFSKVKKLGEFGQIKSYAESALNNNQLAEQFQQQVLSLKDQLTGKLDAEDRLIHAIRALRLKSDVGSFPAFRVALNELDKNVRNALDSKEAYAEVRTVASALAKLNHQSKKIQQQAAGTLQQFADTTQDSAAADFVRQRIELSGVKPAPPESEYRTWTSLDGQFSTEAMLLKFDAAQVQLKKKTGQVITVPLARLSKNDRDYLESQKE